MTSLHSDGLHMLQQHATSTGHHSPDQLLVQQQTASHHLTLRVANGASLPIQRGRDYILGSDPHAALSLPGLAARHALIEDAGLAALLVPGTGRPTHTLLNGRALELGIKAPLREGDVLTLGEHTLHVTAPVVAAAVASERSPRRDSAAQIQAPLARGGSGSLGQMAGPLHHEQSKEHLLPPTSEAYSQGHVHSLPAKESTSHADRDLGMHTPSQPVHVLRSSPHHGNGVPYGYQGRDDELDKISPPVATMHMGRGPSESSNHLQEENATFERDHAISGSEREGPQQPRGRADQFGGNTNTGVRHAMEGPVVVRELSSADDRGAPSQSSQQPSYSYAQQSQSPPQHKLAPSSLDRPDHLVSGTHDLPQQPIQVIERLTDATSTASPFVTHNPQRQQQEQQQQQHPDTLLHAPLPVEAAEHVNPLRLHFDNDRSVGVGESKGELESRPTMHSTTFISTLTNSSAHNASTHPDYKPEVRSSIITEPLTLPQTGSIQHAQEQTTLNTTSSPPTTTTSTSTTSLAGPAPLPSMSPLPTGTAPYSASLTSSSTTPRHAFSDADLTTILDDMLDMSGCTVAPSARVNLGRLLGLFPAEYRALMTSSNLKAWILRSQAERDARLVSEKQVEQSSVSSGGVELQEWDLAMAMLALTALDASTASSSSSGSGALSSFSAPGLSDASLLPLMSDMAELGNFQLQAGWEHAVRRMVDAEHMAQRPRATLNSTHVKDWIRGAAKEAALRQRGSAAAQAAGAGPQGVAGHVHELEADMAHTGLASAATPRGGITLDRMSLLTALLQLHL